MPNLYIVIPAYNEAANIRALVDEWYPVAVSVGPDARILVVNDGSKDATLAVLQELSATRPQLLVADKSNGGHGSAIYHGYRLALDAGAQYIFQTDSDRQTLPEEFSKFWTEREQFDALIGVRKCRQDGWMRVVVTQVLRLVVRAVVGVDVPDANTPFRLQQRDALHNALALVPKGHNLTNVLLSIVFTAQQRRIAWYPITFRPRQGGENHINFPRIVRIGWKAALDLWAFRSVLRQDKIRSSRQ